MHKESCESVDIIRGLASVIHGCRVNYSGWGVYLKVGHHRDHDYKTDIHAVGLLPENQHRYLPVRERLGNHIDKVRFPSYFHVCTRPYFAKTYSDCIIENAARLWTSHGYALTLAAFTFLWYFSYEWAVKTEKKFLDDILNVPNIDRKPKKLKDEYVVVFLSIALPIVFFVLAWIVDRVQLYCFIVIALN